MGLSLGGVFTRGAYTRSSTCVREKVGLSVGRLYAGAYRQRNTVFIDPVSQIIFLLVDISTAAYFFIKCVKKSKGFERWLKNGTIFIKKS